MIVVRARNVPREHSDHSPAISACCSLNPPISRPPTAIWTGAFVAGGIKAGLSFTASASLRCRSMLIEGFVRSAPDRRCH
jgi:hypothetical protein